MPAVAFGRTGPAPSLSNTIEPTLVVEVYVSQIWSSDQGSTVPIIHTLWESMGKEGIPFPHPTHQYLGQVGEQAVWSYDGELSHPYQRHTGVNRLCTLPASTTEPILRMWHLSPLSIWLMVSWEEKSWLPINTWDRMASWSCGYKCERAVPVSHQLQHSGEYSPPH